jgi:chlorobactene glucosyltransferase
MLESARIVRARSMPPILAQLLSWIQSWKIEPQASLYAGLTYAAVLTLVLVRSRRNYLAIPILTPCPAHPDPPDCMVVIPARNEEAIIARAVRSLPPDSVLVIDDESTDRTGPEAEAAGAGVYRVAALPPGAIGKPYACMAGARAVPTKWILFADADTWYKDGALESLIRTAEGEGLSFLSLHPRFEAGSLAEHILTPYAQAVSFTAVHPGKSPEAAFDGRCILVRREAYEFIGGHAVGLNFLVDDLKLAQLAQRHRMKIGLVRTNTLAHARFHDGWIGLWHGIARNAYKFTLLPVSRVLLVLLAIAIAALWLPMLTLVLLGGWVFLALGLGLLPIVLLTPWYRNPVRALLTPVAIYALLPIIAHALYVVLTSTRVPWKGREV